METAAQSALELSCYLTTCTQITEVICCARIASAGKLTVNACVNVTEHVHNKRDVSKNLIDLTTGEC